VGVNVMISDQELIVELTKELFKTKKALKAELDTRFDGFEQIGKTLGITKPHCNDPMYSYVNNITHEILNLVKNYEEE